MIDSNGTAVRGNHVAVSKPARDYRVTFGRDITGRAYTAVVGGVGDSFINFGSANVGRIGAFTIWVLTTYTGTLSDLPFHLTVTCP